MASWAIVAVIAITMGCLVEIMKHRHKGLGRKEKAEFEQKMQQLEQQNQQLQARVEVLERIVTDSGFSVDQAIRDLG
ncbi:hypothetical protein [Ferrimonas pelagia]|uniref:Phage shock protein B n=1 Tax=Ferrimonas pelagia TaxID=1177826 RepID=A0ABP9EL31_9GAMM